MMMFLSTTAAFAGVIIALIALKFAGRDYLYKVNCLSQYILLSQIGFLLAIIVLFTSAPTMLNLAVPVIRDTVIIPILRGQPEATLTSYYTAINNGISRGYLWNAYNLWSSSQKAEHHYDQFRGMLKDTQYIQVREVKLISRTTDSAEIVAEVTAVVDENGVRKYLVEKIDHNLSIEEGWWRVTSFQHLEEPLVYFAPPNASPRKYKTDSHVAPKAPVLTAH